MKQERPLNPYQNVAVPNLVQHVVGLRSAHAADQHHLRITRNKGRGTRLQMLYTTMMSAQALGLLLASLQLTMLSCRAGSFVEYVACWLGTHMSAAAQTARQM
jgi:hypothetical protein